MRTLLIILFSISLKIAAAQDSLKYYFKEVGWTIHLPADFKVLTAAENSAISNRGKQGLEQKLDTSVNVLETITLISAKKSKNYFSATLTRDNSKSDTARERFIKSQEDAIYRAFSKDLKVDSSSTSMAVGTKLFRKFEMIIHVNETTSFSMNLATTRYNKYYFVIAYLYLDKTTKDQIESMFKESVFSK